MTGADECAHEVLMQLYAKSHAPAPTAPETTSEDQKNGGD